MANTYKGLGQSAPLAATLTDLYTVPAGTAAVLSTINVCNRSAVPTTFRVSHAYAGAGDSVEQYLHYDIPISGNASRGFTLGATMAATDVLRVYATLATVSFNLYGDEITP